MLSTSILKSMSAFSKSSPLVSAVPSNLLNEPVTVEITRCLILKCTSECAGSITHFVFAIYRVFYNTNLLIFAIGSIVLYLVIALYCCIADLNKILTCKQQQKQKSTRTLKSVQRL